METPLFLMCRCIENRERGGQQEIAAQVRLARRDWGNAAIGWERRSAKFAGKAI